MSRSQALHRADLIRTKLLTPQSVPAAEKQNDACMSGPCDVYEMTGPWTGITVFFDQARISKISIGRSVDMDPDVKRVNIGKRLKGLTYRLFNHYSDDLRLRLLGPAEGVKDKDKPPNSRHLSYIRYDYPENGIALHITLLKRETVKPLDVMIDFVRPKMKGP